MKMLKKMAALLLAGVMAMALLTLAAMTAHLLLHRRLKKRFLLQCLRQPVLRKMMRN